MQAGQMNRAIGNPRPRCLVAWRPSFPLTERWLTRNKRLTATRKTRACHEWRKRSTKRRRLAVQGSNGEFKSVLLQHYASTFRFFTFSEDSKETLRLVQGAFVDINTASVLVVSCWRSRYNKTVSVKTVFSSFTSRHCELIRLVHDKRCIDESLHSEFWARLVNTAVTLRTKGLRALTEL